MVAVVLPIWTHSSDYVQTVIFSAAPYVGELTLVILPVVTTRLVRPPNALFPLRVSLTGLGTPPPVALEVSRRHTV